MSVDGENKENLQSERPQNTDTSLNTPPNYANQIVQEQWQRWPERLRSQYLDAQDRVNNAFALVRRMSQTEYDAIFGKGRGTKEDVFIPQTEQSRVFALDRVYQFSNSQRNRGSGYERIIRIKLDEPLKAFLKKNLAPDNIPGGVKGGLKRNPRFKFEDGDYNIVIPKASWDVFRQLIQNHTMEVVE